MKRFTLWFSLGVVALFAGLLGYALHDENLKRQQCSAKGGAWLYNEQVCLKGEQIPLE